jgi:hypothetical protein
MIRWEQALCAGLAVTAWGAPNALADDTRVRNYLEHGMAVHAAAGYVRERTIPDLETPLRLDHPHLWSIELNEGVNYRVYGACDDACADLDMEIYGADGALVERDSARDDTPFVQITPTQSGRHFVRLWLYACAAESCAVAARVMSGGSPAPR